MQKNIRTGAVIRVQVSGYTTSYVELFNPCNSFAFVKKFDTPFPYEPPNPLFVGSVAFPFNLTTFGDVNFGRNITYNIAGGLMVYNEDNTALVYGIGAGASVMVNGSFSSGFSYYALMEFLKGNKIKFSGLRLYCDNQTQLIQEIEIFRTLPDGFKQVDTIRPVTFLSPSQIQPNMIEMKTINGELNAVFGMNYIINSNTSVVFEFLNVEVQV
jgi:hypothetical protein